MTTSNSETKSEILVGNEVNTILLIALPILAVFILLLVLVGALYLRRVSVTSATILTAKRTIHKNT